MKTKLLFLVALIVSFNVVPSIKAATENSNMADYSFKDKAVDNLLKMRMNNIHKLNDKFDCTAEIISADAQSKGVFINTNIVVTVAHGIKDEQLISVNSRPAYLIDIDREKDYAILETMYSNDNYMEISTRSKYITTEYQHGDSGSQILDEEGNLYGILIGKNLETGKYIVLPMRSIVRKIKYLLPK